MPHPLIDSIATHARMFVRLRHELHQCDERGLSGLATSDLVAGRLEQWGYRVERAVDGSAVVGQLRRGKGGRRLGLHAAMHAHGVGASLAEAAAGEHFGHAAMLLAAAHYLARQGDFSGTLNLVFQCAGPDGAGAHRMPADGLFDKHPCDALFSMQHLPGLAQGHLLVCDGPALASCDEVHITLHGAHAPGAMQQRMADAVVAGAAIVMGVQSIVARNVDPQQMAAVRVAAFETADSCDGIAQNAALRLEVRAFDDTVRETLQRRITELAELQALSYGVQATVDYRRKTPAVVNSPQETDFARQVAQELLGPGRVASAPRPLAGSGDVGMLLQQVPGAYLLIGSGTAADQGFDDSNLPIGAAYWAMLAQCYLH